jgi:hypothetical protein
MDALLVAVELVGASVWIGGLVAVAVVARVARGQLDPPARVAFFRSLGRRYLRVGGTALVVAYADGAVLLARGPWSDARSVALGCAVALACVTLAGVAQARSLTRLRTAALAGDPRIAEGDVVRHARRAAALRGLIAALTLAVVLAAAVLLA